MDSFPFLLIILAILFLMLPDNEPKTQTSKTCYVTEWKWEKASNGVPVRVPVKQVCVKGEGE